MSRRWTAAAGAALLAVLPACAAGTVAPLPAPPTTESAPTGTTLADTTGVSLSGVPGQTTTTAAAIGPGHATLSGTVTGPQGPVPQATVEADRVTDAGTVSAVATTAADGSWSISHILGGRYRVRAWRAPDLAQTAPVVFFLGDLENHPIQLQLQQYGGTQLLWSIAPNPPIVDEPAQLVIRLVVTAVDPSSGVVGSNGVGGAGVQLTGSSNWTVQGSDTATTDGSGSAAWQMVCSSAGSQPLQVQVTGAQSYPVDGLPDCVRPPPPTTTTTSTTTTLLGGSTTTTAPPPTTSTTRKR